jgi:hypothetical protein
MSFSFLSEQYVMFALTFSGTNEFTMRLDIFDLGHAHEYSALFALPVCSFGFPVSRSGRSDYEMSIRCDVTSGRTSHSYGSVPFSTSQSDRLYVVSCTPNSQETPPLILFVHLSTLLAKISTLPPGTKGHQFAWTEWGEEGARLLHLQPSPVWITHVHGTKFALIRNQQLEVYDFNKLSVKRNRIHMLSHMESNTSCLLGSGFVGPVYSRLPYDLYTVPSGHAGVNISLSRSVLLTEDSLILIPVSGDHSMLDIVLV